MRDAAEKPEAHDLRHQANHAPQFPPRASTARELDLESEVYRSLASENTVYFENHREIAKPSMRISHGGGISQTIQS
jgi:hypothetical protein